MHLANKVLGVEDSIQRLSLQQVLAIDLLQGRKQMLDECFLQALLST